MTDSAKYAKIVEWSEEDQGFVGSSPGLIYGGCHGQDEKAVFEPNANIAAPATTANEAETAKNPTWRLPGVAAASAGTRTRRLKGAMPKSNPWPSAMAM